MNEVIGFAAVIVSILAATLLNNSRIDKLETRMDTRFTELNGRVDRIQADLITFYRDLGRHDSRLDNLEKH